MWSRSRIERSSLNSKPDSVKITIPLRKLRNTEDKEDDANNKYNLTPRCSLRITSRHIRKTIFNLNRESSNIFAFPKSPKKTDKFRRNSGNAVTSETSNAKNGNKDQEKIVTNQNHKRLEKDSPPKRTDKRETRFQPQHNPKRVEDPQIKHKQAETKDKTEKLENKNKSMDFERMLRLGLALDWNHNNRSNKNSRKRTNRKEPQVSKASAPNSFGRVMGTFSSELDCMKSHFEDKRSKDEQVTAESLIKGSLENGWINYGNQKNCQLPHQYMCPFEETIEDKLGRIDGLVTLEALLEQAYEAKEKAKTPCDFNVASRRKRSAKTDSEVKMKDMSSIKCRPIEKSLPEIGLQSNCESREKSTNLSYKADAFEKSQLWKEKANRWASGHDNLNDLTDEEKLTKAWKESLARWEAEKSDLSAEVSKNHYAIGKRFQNNSAGIQRYSSHQEKGTEGLMSGGVSCPSNKNRQYPFVMSKGDIKAFCFHWDKASEPIRNTLMIKFLKLYSEWDNPLEMHEVLNCGANLLFMRFAMGFKVSFIKKCRCWRYIECILIFLQSLENETFARQLLEINILEDILELVRYDESYLFDKLQSLYFLSALLEGSLGEDVIRVISNSGKLMDLLLEFFINCEVPQTLVLCRNILLNIINRTDFHISQVILEAISHLKMSEQTPLKIELIFQVIKSCLCIHPLVINNCGSFILENLNTTDINIMLGIGELAATMIEHSQCYTVIEDIFEKALSPFIDVTYRHEYDETIQKISEKTSDINSVNTKVFRHNPNYHASPIPKRFSQRQDLGSSKTSDCQQTEQFSACFVINFILENQDSSEILCEFGAIGLSLIAEGQNFSKAIQQEGIRMICNLHQRSFECAASYTLLMSDEILSTILTREIDCLKEVSCDVLLHMRQLGYLMLENWKMWNEQVLLPTILELKKDFELAMSKNEDYAVDLNYSAENGTRKCQRVISEALNTPLGQQVGEIRGKLKSAWTKIDEDMYTNAASDLTVNACEDQHDDVESDSDCSTDRSSLEDWITYNTNETESKCLTNNYFDQKIGRNNNDSYIEEIEDTDCDSISYQHDHDEDDAITYEDERRMSNFSEIPIKYSRTANATAGKAAGEDCNKNTKILNQEDQEIRQIAANVSSMRKIIQKYQ